MKARHNIHSGPWSIEADENGLSIRHAKYGEILRAGKDCDPNQQREALEFVQLIHEALKSGLLAI